MPALVDYPEEKFGGFLAVTDYRDPFIQEEIEANGCMTIRQYCCSGRNLPPQAVTKRPARVIRSSSI